MKKITILTTVCVLFVVLLDLTDAWEGNYYTVRRSRWEPVEYCACWYIFWGCSHWRYYWRTTYYTVETCEPGWTHNGDRNCNIPVCRPRCQNGGNCTNPNTCQCPSWSSGIGCAKLTCSYKRPCYPGNCIDGSNCECEPGFVSKNASDGCITFDSSESKLRPVVGKSNVTLSFIRRDDNNKVDFMFTLEGLEEKEPGKMEIIWSNQKRFNNLRFEYDTTFLPPNNLPERPNYVHKSSIGIVESFIEANVSKIPINKGPIRDTRFAETYKCKGFRKDRPEEGVATCVIEDKQFSTLIEHGDWLNIKFKSTSGGFQQLVNTDEGSKNYARKFYNGLQDVREVQFNFDFYAPKHCTEIPSRQCDPDSSILRIENEFTKNPIEMYWSGWEDELSGVWKYYVEVFKLSPKPDGKLVEAQPLNPVFSKTVSHRSKINYPTFTPKEPGMYSVLLETRDFANNSRISRRLVLFDDQSDVTLNKTSQLYVSSAVAETGYKWQTAVQKGQDIKIDVVWSNHFVNEIIEDNKLLNPVDQYPSQFKELEDYNIRFSEKFVSDSLDDHEGKRTLEAKRNVHGIVKFEWAKELTLNEKVPSEGWKEVKPLKENTSLSLKLSGGSTVRIWVRATDVMGNEKTDNTFVKFDMTEPKLSKSGDEHQFEPNIAESVYNYTSRISFTSSDSESGVHKIGFSIKVKSGDNQQPRKIYEGFAPAAMLESTDDPRCLVVENQCFLPKQTLYLDNCWFLVSKGELESSTASVEVTAYNQALLSSTTVFDVGEVKNLQGLEEYSGPENIRIESPTSTGFRVAWDLPEKLSCYGSAGIVLVLFRKQADTEIKVHTYYTRGTDQFFDIYGLDAVTKYQINFRLNFPNSTAVQDNGVTLQVKTLTPPESTDNTDIIIGATCAIIVVIVIAVVIVVVLVRKGYIHPVQRAQNVRRSVSRKVRQSLYGDEPKQGGSHSRDVAYDNRQSDLYIYSGMDMDAPQIWHIDRHDVTFETLIKSGHFANIYKAQIRRRGKKDVVVAKTLKERFTSEDELLMKAKINFAGGKVGEHPNVLKFIGAVVHDDAMGPFIIYEYCQNGTLRDYLIDRRDSVTVELQENLFRFGLDIAKGMEYLAGKGIVHRRLAARNILLTLLNEVKISGFGPQPAEDNDGDAEKGKKERIPIKWVAPECMESTQGATEKSDVWSYAVVLWEIFSLGDTPYTGKGTDLPKRLKKGERLAKPEHCDNTWYATMKKCWTYEASKRPSFSDIRQELDNLFVAAPGDDYYFYKT